MTKKEVIRDKLVNPTLYTYDYNLMNRLVRVVSHDGTATVYEYDELGNKKAVKHEGGLTISYKYDWRNHPIWNSSRMTTRHPSGRWKKTASRSSAAAPNTAC